PLQGPAHAPRLAGGGDPHPGARDRRPARPGPGGGRAVSKARARGKEKVTARRKKKAPAARPARPEAAEEEVTAEEEGEEWAPFLVGIDLGTTNCALAYLDTREPEEG